MRINESLYNPFLDGEVITSNSMDICNLKTCILGPEPPNSLLSDLQVAQLLPKHNTTIQLSKMQIWDKMLLQSLCPEQTTWPSTTNFLKQTLSLHFLCLKRRSLNYLSFHESYGCNIASSPLLGCWCSCQSFGRIRVRWMLLSRKTHHMTIIQWPASKLFKLTKGVL